MAVCVSVMGTTHRRSRVSLVRSWVRGQLCPKRRPVALGAQLDTSAWGQSRILLLHSSRLFVSAYPEGFSSEIFGLDRPPPRYTVKPPEFFVRAKYEVEIEVRFTTSETKRVISA